MKLVPLLVACAFGGNEPDVPIPEGRKPIDHEDLANMVDPVIDESLYTIRLPYLSVFIPDVLSVMGDNKPVEPAGLDAINLVKLNEEWIEKQKDESKRTDHTQMINVPYTMPMTPHGVYKFMEGSDFCWVLMFYNSDVHSMEVYYTFAQNAAGYFKERCMVGTVNMAYPANRITFGDLVKEYPSMAIRRGGWQTTMLTGKIVHRTFELEPIDKWGYLVSKAELEQNQLASTLTKVLTNVYEPMNAFQKMHAIYTPWYNTKDVNKFHKEVMNHVLDAHFTKLQREGAAPPGKSAIMRYLHENPDQVKEVLLKEGMLSAPAPLPTLHERYYDEL